MATAIPHDAPLAAGPLRARRPQARAAGAAVALIALGFVLRVIVAVWNGFYGPSFGAEADAAEFHRRAVELLNGFEPLEFAIGWVYIQWLAAFYAVIGESLFVGSLLSALAWLASGWMLLRIAREIGLDRRSTVLAALFFALLPTAILHTGVTLREAYQLMFVNLAGWGAVRIVAGRRGGSGWSMLVAGCLGMGVLHGALTGFAAVLVALVVLMRQFAHGRSAGRGGWAWLAATALLLAVLLAFAFDRLFPALQAELLESLIASQQGYVGTEARAQYRSEFAVDGLVDMVAFLPVALAQYLFEPFPWRGLAVVDLGLVAENALRLWLVVCMLRGWRRLPDGTRRPVLLLVLGAIALEAIWAPGTVNWGTAARHHVPGLGLMLLGALACRQAAARRRPRGAPMARGPLRPALVR